MNHGQDKTVAFFDEREAGRYPSITEAMEAVEALREGGISATYLENPEGPSEEGAPCPAVVLVENEADRPRAQEVLWRRAAAAGTSRNRARLWVEVGLVLLVAWLPSMFEGIAAYVWRVAEEGPLTFSAYQEWWLISVELPVIGLVLYLIARDPLRPRDFGLVRPKILPDILGSAVLWYAWALVAALVGAILSIFTSEAMTSPEFEPPPNSYAYGLSFAATLIAVVAEELAFRAYLLPKLRAAVGSRWFAILLAAVFFGASHLYQGIDGVLVTTAWGILNGAVFFMSGRIWPLILAHLAWNLTVYW